MSEIPERGVWLGLSTNVLIMRLTHDSEDAL
jgi:hypothetical protein